MINNLKIIKTVKDFAIDPEHRFTNSYVDIANRGFHLSKALHFETIYHFQAWYETHDDDFILKPKF